MRTAKRLTSLFLAGTLAAGCADSVADGEGGEGGKGGGKADGWDYGGSPERFGFPLDRRFDQLATTGRAAVAPWSETYWPTSEDSFNARWAGASSLSPLEKYDAAFNGWAPPAGFDKLRPLTAQNCASGAWDRNYYAALGPAAKYWSLNKGLGRVMNGIDDDGDGAKDECSDLDGIEYWWGSCHAWTPAAMLEKEPLEPVTLNGVKFEVSDIKALVISLYEESTQIAIGDRCALVNPPRDATGRIIDPACRNTNAGTFHLLLTNLLGRDARAFGEDRVTDTEVWNQPIIGYRLPVYREVDKAAALALLNLAGDVYPYNDKAKRFVEVNADVDYVVETHASTRPTTPHIDDFVRTDHYKYVLELDEAGNVIGGEWITARSGASVAQNDRPDYLWLPLGPGKNPNPNVNPAKVRELLRLSRPDTRNLAIKTYSKDDGRQIPDYPWAGLESKINVADDLVVEHVVVRAEVLHSWSYDLQIRLLHDGREQMVFNRNPQGTSTDFTATWIADSFVGTNAKGDWTLVLTDRESRSIGRLANWSLELTGRPPGGEPTPTPTPEPTPSPVTLSGTGVPLDIPDNQPNGVAASIEVPPAAGAVVKKVRVKAEIKHTYRGDLLVTLEHDGAMMTLHAGEGGSADDLALDREAAVFAGARREGVWTLRVVDRARQDIGRLEAWSLTLE